MSFATEATITDVAVDRWRTAYDERLGEVMESLIRHLHAFARETGLTHEEWLAGMEFVTRLGQISDEKRQEVILASDVLGLSMLVVMLNARPARGITPSTVLGPFHIDGSPTLPIGGELAEGIGGTRAYVSGRVLDADGAPIANALLDLWQADAEGAYESQLGASEPRLRGLQRSDREGRYGFWTIAPKGYTIPMDGPVGDLIGRTQISHFRPAHIHFMIIADGYKPLVTHLFEQGAPYLESDVVFGALDELVTPFTQHPAAETPTGQISATPFVTVNYDFVLDRAA